MGDGAGHLTLLAHAGDVSLSGHVDAVGRIAGKGIGASLLWSLGVAALLAWYGHHVAMACVLIFWTGTELLRLFKIYRRIRRLSAA